MLIKDKIINKISTKCPFDQVAFDQVSKSPFKYRWIRHQRIKHHFAFMTTGAEFVIAWILTFEVHRLAFMAYLIHQTDVMLFNI
jgi:hypothetical protein